MDATSQLLSGLLKVPSTETSSANTGALQALLAQLVSTSSAGGAADQIKQIFTAGKNAGMPLINQAITTGGARGGTSSYQVLASNDLSARLAGQGALQLQTNAQAATQAANQLAVATKKVTTAPSLTGLLTNAGVSIGVNAASKKLGQLFSGSPDITNFSAGSATGMVDPTLAAGYTAGTDLGSITGINSGLATLGTIGSATGAGTTGSAITDASLMAGIGDTAGLTAGTSAAIDAGASASAAIDAAGIGATAGSVPVIGTALAAIEALAPNGAAANVINQVVGGVGNAVSDVASTIGGWFGF
jgi:hypothetical protein